VNIANSCVGAGAGQGAVYVSEDSMYTTTDNYIDPDFSSSVCTEPGQRLIQEQAGSGCFQANRTDCAFDCVEFFDAESCLARIETVPPSIAPSATVVPTRAPTRATNATSAPVRPPKRAPVTMPTTTAPVTSSPVAQPSAGPSGVPFNAPHLAPSIAPSQAPVGKPTLRPSLAPLTGAPNTKSPGLPTARPSCECKGKGKKKSKKDKDGGMGKGKGKSKGKGKGLKGASGDDDDDDDDFVKYADDLGSDECICPSKKSKKDGGKGNDTAGKGGGKGEAKVGKGLSYWMEHGTALHDSRVNNGLHHLGGY
jgi:hypothetical protein